MQTTLKLRPPCEKDHMFTEQVFLFYFWFQLSNKTCHISLKISLFQKHSDTEQQTSQQYGDSYTFFGNINCWGKTNWRLLQTATFSNDLHNNFFYINHSIFTEDWKSCLTWQDIDLHMHLQKTCLPTGSRDF